MTLNDPLVHELSMEDYMAAAVGLHGRTPGYYVSLAQAARNWLADREGWGPKPAEQAEANEPCLAETRDMLWFVASRFIKDGSGANFREGRCTGISSDALAFYGIGMRGEPKDHEYPADESDLAACERTYEMAPSRVQERMLPVLQSYRLAVASEAQERKEED